MRDEMRPSIMLYAPMWICSASAMSRSGWLSEDVVCEMFIVRHVSRMSSSFSCSVGWVLFLLSHVRRLFVESCHWAVESVPVHWRIC
jgi:hypothetical protein